MVENEKPFCEYMASVARASSTPPMEVQTLPVVRFNKAFRVTGRVKAFLNLEVGATRGKVPDAEQLGALVERVEEQRAMLGRKEREITKLKMRLSAMAESPKYYPTAAGAGKHRTSREQARCPTSS